MPDDAPCEFFPVPQPSDEDFDQRVAEFVEAYLAELRALGVDPLRPLEPNPRWLPFWAEPHPDCDPPGTAPMYLPRPELFEPKPC